MTSTQVTPASTKTIVPKRAPEVVRRQRLLDFLQRYLQRKLVLVIAPAGYGKTTLLADFASVSSMPVAWYSLDSDDRDPHLLLWGIVQAIERRFPNSLGLTRHHLRQPWTAPDAWKVAVAALVNEALQIGEHFVLVLDDMHHVEAGQPALQMMDYLLEHQPQNLHLLFASRERLPLKGLPRLKASRELAELEAADLAFTADELQAMLARAHGSAIAAEEIERLIALTEGWPAAAVLLSPMLWEGGVARSIASKGSSGELFDYLAAEVLSRADEPVKRFLLSVSVLDEFTPELCDALLESTGSLRTCQEIEQRYGLIASVTLDGDRRSYRFHTLLRQFLRETLRREDPDGYRRLQLRAADLLRGSDPARAIEHYLEARQQAEASACLAESAEALVQNGNPQALLRLLERIPEPWRAGDARLCYWEAEARRLVGDVWLAIQKAESAIALFAQQEDPIGQARALIAKGAALRQLGEQQRALDAFQQAIALAQGHPHGAAIVAVSLHHLAIAHYLNGRLHDARALLEQALTSYQEHERYRRGLALWDLAVVQIRLGQLEQAVACLEKARIYFQQLDHVSGLAGVFLNLGTIYRLYGAYDAAESHLERGHRLARATSDRRVEAGYYKALADLALDKGEFTKAQELYRQARAYAEQVSDLATAAEALAGLAEALARGGDPKQAELLIAQGMALAKDETSYALGLFLNALGLVQMLRGLEEQAVETLVRASRILEACAAPRYAAVARLRLAQCLFEARHFTAALESLERVAEHSEAVGTHSFLVPEAYIASLLLEYGISRRVARDFCARLKQELQERQADGDRTAPALTTPHAPPVEVQALGQFRVLVDGRELTPTAWNAAKTKELLLYLLLHPSAQHRDKIMADLWPDLSSESAIGAFHTSLWRLRKALYPGCVLLQREASYLLNPEGTFWCDASEFQTLIAQAQRAAERSPERASLLERALELYQGPLAPTCYAEWCEAFRNHFEELYLWALGDLVNYCLDSGAYEKAVILCKRLVREAPYEETGYLQLMTALARLGRYDEVKRHFQEFRERLAQEGLGEPSRAFVQQYQRLAQGRIAM